MFLIFQLKEPLEQRQDFRRGSQGPASIAERTADIALNKGHKAKKRGRSEERPRLYSGQLVDSWKNQKVKDNFTPMSESLSPETVDVAEVSSASVAVLEP